LHAIVITGACESIVFSCAFRCARQRNLGLLLPLLLLRLLLLQLLLLKL
jgi:hypothetical protein